MKPLNPHPADVDAFLKSLRQTDGSPNTILSYQADLRSFTAWFSQTNGETLTLKKLTPTDAREYRTYLAQRRHLSANTINRHLASLCAFTRWGVANRRLTTDPLVKLKRIAQASRRQPHWLDKQQRYALRRVIERELQESEAGNTPRARWRLRNVTLLLLLLHTGLRAAEAVALDWEQLTLQPRSGSVKILGKGLKERTVPLNAEVRRVLQRWATCRSDESVSAVFGSQTSSRLTARSLENIVAAYGRRAQLPQLTPHVLRHTFAKTLIDGGVPIDQVAQLLGHARLETTRIYTAPSQRDLEQAVTILEES